MKQFDYYKIMQDNTVVHCDTEEKANNLLEWADSKDLKWCHGREYSKYNQWEDYKQSTCYNLKQGTYSGIKSCKQNNCNILTYEEVLIKEEEMKNKEIQTEFKIGDKVEVDVDNLDGTNDFDFLESLNGVKMEIVEITDEYKNETIPTFKCINSKTKQIIIKNKGNYFPFVELDLKKVENIETQFKLGDKVWSFVYGWGEVSKITNDRYPIYVNFKSKIDNGNFIINYTNNGEESPDVNQSLFFDEIKFKVPKRPLPQLEVDTKVLVRNSTSDRWEKKYFSNFDEDGNMCCFYDGSTSWSGKGTSNWKYWKLA